MPKATDRVLITLGDEHHLIDPGKLLLSELVTVEKVTGMSWPVIWLGLNRGEARAIQAVVWMMRKRHNPKLKLSDVEFSMEDYRLKDPDFLPDYWIPEGDEEADNPPESVVASGLIDTATEQDGEPESGDPKAEDRPQDQLPEATA